MVERIVGGHSVTSPSRDGDAEGLDVVGVLWPVDTVDVWVDGKTFRAEDSRSGPGQGVSVVACAGDNVKLSRCQRSSKVKICDGFAGRIRWAVAGNGGHFDCLQVGKFHQRSRRAR